MCVKFWCGGFGVYEVVVDDDEFWVEGYCEVGDV